jgi:hypothetical protein
MRFNGLTELAAIVRLQVQMNNKRHRRVSRCPRESCIKNADLRLVV